MDIDTDKEESMVTSQAIDQILAEGYRNIKIIPVPKKPAFHYLPQEYRVLAMHWTKNPTLTGNQYPVGSIVEGKFYDDVPF